MGSAIFWDLVEDKTVDGFSPRNVVTIMTSPLTGTLVPGAGARTEVQGIGVQSYPIGWFTRSNLGGRFGAMLKYAGWDGIVIEGKADKPVWVDIRNGSVEIKDASGLWGLDTWETQQRIWDEVMSGNQFGDWLPVGDANDPRRTTQRPAVLAIGPAGERLGRIACLVHDAGSAAGQGGFGGVWGSKNLKAISVIGTGSIEIADPNALMEARLWAMKRYGYHVDHKFGTREPRIFMFLEHPRKGRLQACIGCHEGCRNRSGTAQGNESQCIETLVYSDFDKAKHGGKQTTAAYIASDLLQKYGINACEVWKGLPYVNELNEMGVLGKGKQIECDLAFDKLGEIEFAERLLHLIAYREGIGDDLAEGFFRAAQRWGRLDEDLKAGRLRYPCWGLPDHYDPRASASWGYGTILGDRDINSHDFNLLFWWPSSQIWSGKTPEPSAEWVTRIIAEKLVPYEGNPLMLDFSTGNIYSENMARLVAWHLHYTRFWKQSVLYCDYRWPDFVNVSAPDGRGLTGEGEPRFLNAVTGKKCSFLDGMNLGRKIWNLDNAIWALQGRHKNMVRFADYIYEVPFRPRSIPSYYLPGRRNGQWDYVRVDGRRLDRDKVDQFKTTYYELEEWDPSTGWPTRETLESLELTNVADTLAKNAKLGA